MNELHKPFRLIQNDDTKESWLWFPENSSWHKCEEREFEPLKSFAQNLRDAKDPLAVLHYVSLFVSNMNENSSED